MTTYQLHITHFTSSAEALENQLLELGALAVTLQDAADQPIFEPDPNQTPLWQHTQLTALFDQETTLQLARAALLTQEPTLHIEIETLAEQNWERAWMDHFQPMQFGSNTWICPSWCAPPNPNAINILLDPGLAFGTGTHPTTALCLEWIDSHPIAGKTVIDFGCGSGILAIAALLHGAARVYAIDHDPQALQATQDNAQRNGIDSARLTILTPGQVPNDLSADIILANILAKPLIELAPYFAKLLHADGTIVLSGILTTQSAKVCQAYAPFCPAPIVISLGDWTRISLKNIS